MSEICERSGAPTKGEQEGKAPAESGGRGKYSPPATPERVTSKALKRRESSVMPAKRHSSI
jgi:hypothetical protein